MSDKPYAVHPGVKMEEKILVQLKEKTGRSLEEWVAFIRRSGPAGEKERVAWLKSAHALGTNYAQWLASRCEEGRTHDYDPEGYVEKMFSGKRAGLRPLYDRLLELGYSLGADVTVTPCTTMVPLRRKYVFAQIKPASNTRIDFGLALGDRKATARLIDTGGFAKKDRITHRIAVSSLDDIDAELVSWLKKAYEATPAGN